MIGQDDVNKRDQAKKGEDKRQTRKKKALQRNTEWQTEKWRVDRCEDREKDAGQAEKKKLITLMDGAVHNPINTTLSSSLLSICLLFSSKKHDPS